MTQQGPIDQPQTDDSGIAPVETPAGLLELLVYLTARHQRPLTAASLIAGLPSPDGRLTSSLFIRAAERAGFIATIRERSLEEIDPALLPVVLLLEDDKSCLLHEVTPDGLRVSWPDAPDKTATVAPAEIGTRYNGHCILFRDNSEHTAPKGHWFWETINKSRGIYVEVIVASLLVNLFALVTPLFIMNVYDRVVPNQAFETLWVLASGVGLVFLFDILMKTLRGYFIDAAGKRADIILSSRTFARVLDIEMASRPNRVGAFANNLQEFDGFRDFFTSTTLVTLIDLPFVLLFVAIIYSIAGSLALVPLVAIPLVILSGLIVQRPLQRVIKQSFQQSAAKHAMLIETLSNLDTVKGSRAEGVLQQRWESFNAAIAKLSMRSRLLSLSAVNVAQFIQQASTVAVVIMGVYAILGGNLTVGGLIACTILTGRCLAPMSQLANILTRYHHAIAAYGAIDGVMSLPVERPVERQFLHRPDLGGDIEFRDVTFSYPDQQTPSLAGVSFTIRTGEKVAIIGKTGSGKSTVEKLALKFYPPAGGSILVNGTDLNQVDPSDLRQSVSYVPQDITLFSGTVRENIALGAPLATDADIQAAAKLAGISDFLDQHPAGYDLNVGERGSQLSGGQRQAIAIARALINDAPTVMMDEPTNAMDNATELAFVKAMQAYLKDRTLLLVTHKASMLSLVDRLLVLNDGKIVADGPREEVLKLLRTGGAS